MYLDALTDSVSQIVIQSEVTKEQRNCALVKSAFCWLDFEYIYQRLVSVCNSSHCCHQRLVKNVVIQTTH